MWTYMTSMPIIEHRIKMLYYASVPSLDYNRIWGYAVSGSIGWNLLRLFWPDRFNLTAQLSSQLWVTVKNYPRSSDLVWHVRLPPITSDFHFPVTQVLQLPIFHPTLRSPIRRANSIYWLLKQNQHLQLNPHINMCVMLWLNKQINVLQRTHVADQRSQFPPAKFHVWKRIR